MAITSKKPRSEKVKANYMDNTVEMVIDGKTCRVNKFEAKDLQAKLDKKSAAKKSNAKKD